MELNLQIGILNNKKNDNISKLSDIRSYGVTRVTTAPSRE